MGRRMPRDFLRSIKTFFYPKILLEALLPFCRSLLTKKRYLFVQIDF